MAKHRTLDTASNGVEIQQVLLSYLKLHRKWYAYLSQWFPFAWNSATILIVVLGALSSILAAARLDMDDRYHPLLIILPAVSSLLATLLTQFRLKESCRLRELGRIGSEELICKAYLIPTDDREAALRAAIELRLAAHKLERDQLLQWATGQSQRTDSSASSEQNQDQQLL